MLKQCVKHYYQWLHSTIHCKTKISQTSRDSLRIQGPSERSSSGLLPRISSVKERYRKGRKVKSLWVLQSPVSSPQASQKVEASDRSKQDQHLSISRKIQNGNTRVNLGLSDSRGMGVVYRPVRYLPSHPNPPSLKEVPMVLPWFSSVFTMIAKEVKLMTLTSGVTLH